MFIGRERELEFLNSQYMGNMFSFIPIYGRRRIGKTRLIEEFIRDKKAIFFTAVCKGTYDMNMELLSKAIFEGRESIPVYRRFTEALDEIYRLAEKEKLVFVIDEFPYLVQSEGSILSILQQYIDLKFIRTNMMLILSGSSLSFMENQVLGYQSPIYGRRSGQIKLAPLNFNSSRQFAPNLLKAEQAVMYGITGGIPQYLSLFNDNLSLDENITELFFNRNAYLFEETNNLLKQEFTEPALYQAIINSIATGSSQIKDIAGKVKEESSKVATYIKPLLDTGIIKKEIPVMDKPNSRKTIYRLADGMFRFWYRFVYPNVSLINLDRGEQVYDRIKEQIPIFMGEVFENICIEYMWSIYEELPFNFQNIGRWWGNNPEARTQEEIDFIAYREDKNIAIFGECKWRNELLGKSIIEGLMRKSNIFAWLNQKYYFLFSKSGFSDSAVDMMSSVKNIRLIDFNDMYEQ